jgi:hypothetical protein
VVQTLHAVHVVVAVAAARGLRVTIKISAPAGKN